VEALSDMTLGSTAKEQCVKHLTAYLASPEGAAAAPAAVVAQLREMQVKSGLMLKECPYIYVSAALDGGVLKAGQVKAAAPVLKALVATDANKFMARHLIGALEEAFGSRLLSLQKAFPVVLKQVSRERSRQSNCAPCSSLQSERDIVRLHARTSLSQPLACLSFFFARAFYLFSSLSIACAYSFAHWCFARARVGSSQLYDEDVLDEDVLVDWATQGVTYEFSPQSLTTEQVKIGMAAAEPFIAWLKDADEDSD
jgi:hypothetical protein